MRKLIAWPVAEGLYWVGHGLSLVFEWLEWDWTYSAYQWCMLRSVDVNEWGGLSLWGPVISEDGE